MKRTDLLTIRFVLVWKCWAIGLMWIDGVHLVCGPLTINIRRT